MVPRPIVATVYSQSARHQPDLPGQLPTQTGNPAQEPSLFHTKQRQLEADLQLLLDAQAHGLLAALTAQPSDDDAVSTGSSTPTALSINMPTTSISAQRSPKIGLRQARKAIYTTMRRLALLKTHEFDCLTPEVEECSAIVDQLDKWHQKRERLQERTRQIHQGDEHKRASDLRRKADDMQANINQLEATLAQLKTQQTKLRRDALDCENEVQANLSSYTATLNMLDKDSKTYLTHLQREKSLPAFTPLDRSDTSTSPLRTARRMFHARRTQLRSRQAQIEEEKDALEQGAVVWKHVVKDVSDFERKLQEDMTRMSLGKTKPRARPAQDKGDTPVDDEAADQGMQSLLEKLDQTTSHLEVKYKLAETRHWNLLVAAIGAELEAFLKGKAILEDALALSAQGTQDSNLAEHAHDDSADPSIYDNFRTPGTSVIRHVDDGQAIRDLDHAFDSKHDGSGAAASDTDTEDDGPDPELLISHQDTDDE